MKDKRTSKIAAHHYPFLDGEIILHGTLNEVLTGKKNLSVEQIRKDLTIESDNPNLKKLQKEKLDVAIVVYLQKTSYKNQDVDNLTKVILDALKKPPIDDGRPYFFEDDCQVARILIYKKEREEDQHSNTCQISISMRKHDPKKEMNLFVEVHDENLNFRKVLFCDLKENNQ